MQAETNSSDRTMAPDRMDFLEETKAVNSLTGFGSCLI